MFVISRHNHRGLRGLSAPLTLSLLLTVACGDNGTATGEAGDESSDEGTSDDTPTTGEPGPPGPPGPPGA